MKKKRNPIYRVNDEFTKNFRCGQHMNDWKWDGYELMRRVEEWAKKRPKDVFVAGIDDTYFSSSSLVLVLHRTGKRLWGISCYVLTQCDGIPPKEFFMYPGHAKTLRMALSVAEKFEAYWPTERSKKYKTMMKKALKGKVMNVFGSKVLYF